MKTAPHVISEPRTSSPERASSVMMGRQDYTSVLLRLIGMELYKLRRRLMSKVLGGIAILAMIGLFALIAVGAFYLSRGGSTLDEIAGYSRSLRLPSSLYLIVQLLNTLGQILIIILVSTIVGGEYADKTARLMLTRGPTRTQYLFAKVGVAAVCIILGVVGITVLGIISGLVLNLSTGVVQSFDFFTLDWFDHTLLYLLITMLGLFTYAMMALFLSTLGRATAAGLAGVLTWSFVVEPIIEVGSSFGRDIGGAMGNFFQALPDYLIGTNISQLQQDQSHYVYASAIIQPAALQADLHSLLVLAVYLLLFIGLAWWVNMRRDVII
ncbi:MAG: ABC transporter permease [Ktedonobacteraceae bacterium]